MIPTFLRALRLRCPRCGGKKIFRRWALLADTCPTCHLLLDRREPGYLLGGLWLNLLFAESVTASLFVGTLIFTWPNPPWDLLKILLPTLALLTPVFFYPFSKVLFLALDLSFRREDQ